jgi:uncharacterized membrane protein
LVITNRTTETRATETADVSDAIVRNVEGVVQLEQRERLRMGTNERIANWLAAFSGSMLFVWLHVLWFGAWVVINRGLLGMPKFDPFPFGLLTMMVSLESIFLSTFVLISQNRQAVVADRRAKVDVQVNAIAEQEVTKLLHMVEEMQEFLGMTPSQDAELHELKQPTDLANVMDAIDNAEERIDPRADKGPESAMDTEA